MAPYPIAFSGKVTKTFRRKRSQEIIFESDGNIAPGPDDFTLELF